VARRKDPGFALDRTVTHRLHTLNKLTDQATQLAYTEATGLPLSDARCLGAIGAFAPLSVNELARRSNLDKGQASRAAQSLVEQGLVRKEASPDDARSVVLSLTREGTRAWQRVMDVIARRNEQITACLSDAERAVLAELLDKLLAHAHQLAGADGAPTGNE
jgi:DNA-binding MarR family transcriptional regulator